MSKRKNQRDHGPTPHADARPGAPHDEAPEAEREPWHTALSRQQSMASRVRETRTKMQPTTMRPQRGNQRRGG